MTRLEEKFILISEMNHRSMYPTSNCSHNTRFTRDQNKYLRRSKTKESIFWLQQRNNIYKGNFDKHQEKS